MRVRSVRNLTVVFLALAATSMAQSGVVGWGRARFNSAYNDEAFMAVSAGHAYTLALRPDGTIAGWGLNHGGALDVPALPTGLTYVQISGALAGWASAALRSDGSVVVWGDTGYGQWNVPALPPGLSYSHVSAGGGHIVALRSDGAILAWGDNSYGQCDVPALPGGLSYVQAEALAGSTLARRSDGAIVVWGDTGSGQAEVPALSPGNSFVELAAGGMCTIARVGAGVPCGDWNLARDFRVSPDQENPNRDICGNLGVWSFLENDPATFPAHDPATYTLLPDFIPDLFSVQGLECWRSLHLSGGNQLPLVGINNTGSFQAPLGIQWPAGAVLVHPPFDGFAIVGWRSPWTGSVAVTGGVEDVQFGSSDGIGWSIDHFDGLNNTVLAWGSVPEVGAQAFQSGSGGSSLANVAVSQGDFLFFLVDPQAWAGGDSTRLDIVITPTSACLPPTTYCIAAINSTGQGAHIGWQGSTSLAQNGLVLLARGCPPNNPGLFFFGSYPTQIPFGEGYLCVTGNQHRLQPVVFADAIGFAALGLDFTDPGSPASLIQPGEEWRFQFWYRDPQTVGHGFNFTDALHATFCP